MSNRSTTLLHLDLLELVLQSLDVLVLVFELHRHVLQLHPQVLRLPIHIALSRLGQQVPR